MEDEMSKTWWSEGNRKLIMVGVALVVFGAVVIAWMFAQPAGVTLGDLITWVGGVVSALTTLGVGGNVFEHALKANPPTGKGDANMSATNTLLVLLAFSGLALGGCGGPSSVTVGELLPDVEVSRTEGGCLKVRVDQPVPVVDGWAVRSSVEAVQVEGCGGGGGAENQ